MMKTVLLTWVPYNNIISCHGQVLPYPFNALINIHPFSAVSDIVLQQKPSMEESSYSVIKPFTSSNIHWH